MFRVDNYQLNAANYLVTDPFSKWQVNVHLVEEGKYRGYWVAVHHETRWYSEPRETLADAQALAKAYLLGRYAALTQSQPSGI